MRCLFCKCDSSLSRSVEHVIPESLGNFSHILHAGSVCDGCNNYFARKVEKPFLDLDAIEIMRFHQDLKGKNGGVPPLAGLLVPSYPAVIYPGRRNSSMDDLFVSSEGLEDILRKGRGKLFLPAGAVLGIGPVVSRFVAKVALEAIAERLADHPVGVEYLVDEEQLDPLRNHARYGQISFWPIHQRRIYPEQQKWLSAAGAETQVVHEYDFLVTDWGEWFFVLVIFGLELVLNIAGPDIEGYQRWLVKNLNACPLYVGKNVDNEWTPVSADS